MEKSWLWSKIIVVHQQISHINKFIHNNDEVSSFKARITSIGHVASFKAGLPSIDYGVVIDNLAIKYATGKLAFDPTRGVKESTYLYRIAFNEACDYRRRFYDRSVGWEKDKKETLPDPIEDLPKSARLDTQVVAAEALRRVFAHERDCNRQTLEITVRYAILGEPREELARVYGRAPDNISLIKTRLLPKLQRHFREVMREDRTGTLKLSTTNLDFLKPFLPWI